MQTRTAQILIPTTFVMLWSTGFIGARLGLPYSEPFTFLGIRLRRSRNLPRRRPHLPTTVLKTTSRFEKMLTNASTNGAQAPFFVCCDSVCAVFCGHVPLIKQA